MDFVWVAVLIQTSNIDLCVSAMIKKNEGMRARHSVGSHVNLITLWSLFELGILREASLTVEEGTFKKG